MLNFTQWLRDDLIEGKTPDKRKDQMSHRDMDKRAANHVMCGQMDQARINCLLVRKEGRRPVTRAERDNLRQKARMRIYVHSVDGRIFG